MFIDEAEILVRSGKGGDGIISFHREKYRPRGGPDGGDGGRGGSVILRAGETVDTLLQFKRRAHFYAEDGEDGGPNRRTGRSGQDLTIPLPVGTVIKEATTGEVLADLAKPGANYLAARGGEGGRGNARFATSTYQAPRICERGELGEKRQLKLELKLLADAGIIGYPNVGKSTLISAVSAARPKVAPYPFTTLEPHLGVAQVDDFKAFIMVDIPGLIEGAHRGKGLGDRFLQHVERTRLLLHMVDLSGMEGRTPLQDYQKINAELRAFSPPLAERPQIVVGNKIDLLSAPEVEVMVKRFAALGIELVPISAATGSGIGGLIELCYRMLKELKGSASEVKRDQQKRRVYRLSPEPGILIQRDVEGFIVTGKRVRRLARLQIKDQAGLNYLNEALERLGVLRQLKVQGLQSGDLIRLGDLEFEYRN